MEQNQGYGLHDVLKRFSSSTRLKHITAWCRRFIQNSGMNVTQTCFRPVK